MALDLKSKLAHTLISVLFMTNYHVFFLCFSYFHKGF